VLFIGLTPVAVVEAKRRREEQAEIVRRARGALDQITQLEERLCASFADLDQLDQAILAKAFRGELVPQDPNDEPASALLERIRVQKAQQAEATKGQKKMAKTQRPNTMAKLASGLASQHQMQPHVSTVTGQRMSPEQLQLEY
jgi:type I restriction enzyme S subunit